MSTYAKLVRLLWDATKELNLQSLTESDRMIYMLLVETSKKGLTKVTYDELSELISRSGTPRSATYQISALSVN